MTSAQILELTPESIASLDSRDIHFVVEAAIRLDRDIKLLQGTLGLLKAHLIKEAEAEWRKSGDKKQEGTSWTYHDRTGEIARVSFPEPKLLSGFWLHDGKAFRYDSASKKVVLLGDIEAACDGKFKKLFSNTIYKPVKGFREIVGALLPNGLQRRLLAMVTLPSSPRVNFGTAAAEVEE